MADSRYQIDESDRRLISALRRLVRPTNSDLARQTDLARGTVHTRLTRLADAGVITGWGPEVAAAASDHPVTSFTYLSIAQGTLRTVVAGLATLPEVLEVHVTTGQADLLCRIAARSNDHLHRIIQLVVGLEGVVRANSQLVLDSPISRTTADLIADLTAAPEA